MLELMILDSATGDYQWADSALCAQVGGDLWYPEEGCLGNDAKSVCKVCPVSAECLEFALINNEKFGIWGGVSPSKRKLMRRARGLVDID